MSKQKVVNDLSDIWSVLEEGEQQEVTPITYKELKKLPLTEEQLNLKQAKQMYKRKPNQNRK